MNQLKYSLGWYIIFCFKEAMADKEEFLSQKIPAIDEDQNSIFITIYSGQFGSEKEQVQIHYFFIEDEETYCLIFKKYNQMWYAIRVEPELEQVWWLKQNQDGWHSVSLLGQLQLAQSFQMLFESGLVLEPSKQLIQSKLISEVLEKE